MANSDKNILITPNRNASGIPEITFTGFGNTSISLSIPDSSTGTIEFVNKASNTPIFSITQNKLSGSQLSIGSSIAGNKLEVNNFGDINIKTKKTIISGNGLRLPRLRTRQAIASKGKLAYDYEQKTLIVGDSTSWVTYGSSKESYIKNGLILHYDASRKESYPGSGTVVYDISGSGNGNGGELTGTMTNVGFSTDMGGAFTFNGSNSYIDVNNSSELLRDFSPYTVECYVKITQDIAAEIFGNYGSGYTTNHLWISARYGHYLNGANPYFVASSYTPGYPLPSTYVYHTAITRDPVTRNTALYLNGILNTTSTADTKIAEGIPYRIGADVNGGAEPFGGNLYAIRVYNRALTPKEIQMNFNATRERVGL